MLVRNFGVPDADMFESGRTMRQLFINHKTDFTAKDATVADPYAANWLTSIEASEGTETDETRTDQQQQETADVQEEMEKARKKYIEMKYYIEKAFADKPSIQNKFGLDNYDEAANNQARMVLFLDNLYKQSVVPANNTLLLAAGCVPAQINEINVIRGALADENTEQNAFIEGSPEATQARIEQYNETYEFAQRVNRLSKVVYYGNVVMLNTFNLPEGAQADPDINVRGKVTDTATGNGLKGVSVEVVGLDVFATTNFYGNFHFVSIPAGNYSLKFTRAGYTTVILPITVLATGVVTQNTAMTV